MLNKARDVFWKKGYNGSSMDELVKATGLSRSSIYDSFGDKHGLYLKALRQYQQTEMDRLFKGMPEGMSPKKKIAWIFQNNAARSLDDRQRKGCFILNTSTELSNVDHTVNSFVNMYVEAMEALLQQLVKEGQSTGEITKKFTAKTLARNLLSSMNGLKVMGQVKQDKQMLDDIVRVALSVLEP